MNIHIVNDEKFINKSFKRFEHYYPGKNVFFVLTKTPLTKLKHVELNDRIIRASLTNLFLLNKILSYCESNSCLFIHNLGHFKAHLALQIKERMSLPLFWIFYGVDLYGLLHEKHNYPLYDYPVPVNKKTNLIDYLISKIGTTYKKIRMHSSDLSSVKERFIYKADYFCFWNYHDYKLLKRYYNTNIEFKYFRYFDAPVNNAFDASFEKAKGHILVNHSASIHGNHLTVLKSLKKIDSKKSLNKIWVPLGYGSAAIKELTLSYGNNALDYCFSPILDFIPKHNYFNNLNNIASAIFGNRRQQAGNNVYYLLAAGAKIFLRTDNNLLQHLRDKGYVVYKFEKDLNSIDDLSQLHKGIQKHNRKLVLKEFSQDSIDDFYKSLIP